MTTDRALLQQALEALEYVLRDLKVRAAVKLGADKGLLDIGDGAYRQGEAALTALREVLAQPEQRSKPVAWYDPEVTNDDKGLSWTPGGFHAQPLFATPPEPAQPQSSIREPQAEPLYIECSNLPGPGPSLFYDVVDADGRSVNVGKWTTHDNGTARLGPLFAGPRQSSAALAVVHEQAKDDGLWFHAQTASEAYLQQELRRLHVAVEAEGCTFVHDGSCALAGACARERQELSVEEIVELWSEVIKSREPEIVTFARAIEWKVRG